MRTAELTQSQNRLCGVSNSVKQDNTEQKEHWIKRIFTVNPLKHHPLIHPFVSQQRI